MIKKYVLAGAIGAFLAAASIVQAPIKNISYHLPIEKITESNLEKYAKENEENIRKLLKKIDDLENYRTDNFNEDSLQLLVARLMMGEDEDYPDICKITDAWTPLTRAKRYNSSMREEILRPWQYSCFWVDDSKTFLKTPLEHNSVDFFRDLKLAKDFLDGKYKNPMPGATHYFNPKLVPTPDWVKNMIYLGRIGDHRYYKEKD